MIEANLAMQPKNSDHNFTVAAWSATSFGVCAVEEKSDVLQHGILERTAY